ncbi:MAG: DUF378 domain-containing protein [Patescibacteria group bacterium]
MMKNKAGLHKITFILLIIGGLNWLLLGVFGWEIGELFNGPDALISRIIYILVGISALYELLNHKSSCCSCGKCTCDDKSGAEKSEPMPSDGGEM